MDSHLSKTEFKDYLWFLLIFSGVLLYLIISQVCFCMEDHKFAGLAVSLSRPPLTLLSFSVFRSCHFFSIFLDLMAIFLNLYIHQVATVV